MISWIVATHDLDILDTNLRATLWLEDGDEVVVVQDAPSIAAAYNKGQAAATQSIRCYVHHDVQILDSARLRAQLIEHCTSDVGMVGVIGSTDRTVPWWEGANLGSVIDARMGRIDFGPGGPCATLDGLLLATAQHLEWDESYPGWHLYDHDICRQQLAAGRSNWCLTGGAEMLRHNTAGSSKTHELAGWGEATARYREKWNPGGTKGRPIEGAA